MSEFWAWNPFSVGIKKNKQALGNTKKVLAEAGKLRTKSPLNDYDDISFAADIIKDALEGEDVRPSENILYAMMDVLEGFYHDEALTTLGDDVLSARPNSREAIAVREYLRRQIRFLQNYSGNMADAQKYLVLLARFLMTQIPLHALTGSAEDGFLSLTYSDLLPNVAETVETIIGSSFEDDLRHSNLFDPLRDRVEANMMRVSKIDPRMPPVNQYRYKMPTDAADLTDDEIIDGYLIGTPLRSFFKTELPLAINEQARFEHSHILGGTGHGKTQFIQKWIAKDIERAAVERRSIVVIDSQGDMISKIARLDCFHPEHGALRGKLVIIDPSDVHYPAAINMFAMDEARLASYGAVEREKVQNSAIALYEHFFGELLGAELTAKQGVVFKYLARLMLEIPNATILTLRDLMDDPRPFIPYMDKLTGSARVFFAREFLDKSFNQTKKQISKRLWGVLSTPAFERLFSSTESKIDLFSKMNDGSIILINTAKDLLKQDGASLYGRFFLSMIGQAIMERAVIPEHERTPTFLYVDECQDYFDKTIEVLLAQGRKYKIGVTLAHQHMDQLSTHERASVLANTSIKACGGVNAKDAKMMAQEMHTTGLFLQSMRKHQWDTEFAFSIKHDLPEAMRVKVPFGHLENMPRMDGAAFALVLENNRRQYCWRYTAPESAMEIVFPGMEKKPEVEAVLEVEVVEAPPPMLEEKPVEQIPITGRGGKQHIQIQNAIKSLANQYGWLADLEYQVADGSVDVWMERQGLSIACEITVTTPTDYELRNIEKCIAAGADEIWVISEDKPKLAEIEKRFGLNASVHYFTPDNLPSEIEARSGLETRSGDTVRGYSVTVKQAYTTEADLEMRRDQLARVMKSIH